METDKIIDNSQIITLISVILHTIMERTLKISIESSVPNFSNNSKDKHSRGLIRPRRLISTQCSKTTHSSAWEILASLMHLNSVKTTNRILDQVRDFLIIINKTKGRIIRILSTSQIWYNKEWLKQNQWKRTNNNADQQIKISSETCPNNKSARNIAKRETMAA